MDVSVIGKPSRRVAQDNKKTGGSHSSELNQCAAGKAPQQTLLRQTGNKIQDESPDSNSEKPWYQSRFEAGKDLAQVQSDHEG